MPDADVEAALQRARAGRRPRTRVEVAALLVYRGPLSSTVPPLESRPLRRPLLARLLAGRPAALTVHVLHPRRSWHHDVPRAA